jgi:nitric oxide reductase NorQ protein
MPLDGATLPKDGKPGTAQCQCCGVRDFTWAHPKTTADWHLYDRDGSAHCRWFGCKYHSAGVLAGVLCPQASASVGDYFKAHPSKGRKFQGRVERSGTDRGYARGGAEPSATPAPIPPPAATQSAQGSWSAPVLTPVPQAPAAAPQPVAQPAPQTDRDFETEEEDADSPLGDLISDSAAERVIRDEDAEYVAQDGEVEALDRAIRLGQNVLIIGPPGCGKTQLAYWTAERRLKRELFALQCADGVQIEDVAGYRDLTAGSTHFVDGRATKAARVGGVLYVDEPNAASPGVQYSLFSLLDFRREMVIPQNGGEVVKAAPGFCVIAAMNPEGFYGTAPLNPAFLQRFHCVIRLGYLPKDREIKLLLSRVKGLTQSYARLIVEVATRLRAAKMGDKASGGSAGDQLSGMTSVGTRTLLGWAARVADGEDFKTAARLTVGGLTVDPNEFKVVCDVVDAVTPTSAREAASKKVPF